MYPPLFFVANFKDDREAEVAARVPCVWPMSKARRPCVGASVECAVGDEVGEVREVSHCFVRLAFGWGSAEVRREGEAPGVGSRHALPGAVAGVVRGVEGESVQIATSWGRCVAPWRLVDRCGFGPPGMCVLWRRGGGEDLASGVLLGWNRGDGTHLVAPSLESVASGAVVRAVPCAAGFAVRTGFGSGLCEFVDGRAASISLDWGGHLVAPHGSTGTVACPAAVSAPVAHCVRGAAVQLIEKGLAALKDLTGWLPGRKRVRNSQLQRPPSRSVSTRFG